MVLVLLLGWAGPMRAQIPVPVAAIPRAEEARRFGAELEAGFRAHDFKVISGRLDFRRLAEESLSSLATDAAGRRTFATEFAKGAGPSFEVALKGFASFKLLRVLATNGQQVAVFRALLPSGSINYHQYVLRQSDRGMEIADVHALASGEWFSETIRRLYLLSESHRDPGLAKQLTGSAADLVKNAAIVEKAMVWMQRRQLLDFLDAYRRLPVSLQEERVLLQMRIAAALEAEPQELLPAMEVWNRLHPDDPGPELILLDLWVLRGEHLRAAAGLERLGNTFGGDPHLQALEALQLGQAGQEARARELATAAVRAEPGLAGGHDALIGLALRRKDYPEVAGLLDAAGKALGRDPRPMVEEQPQYEAFRESPAGKKWLESRP